MPKYFSHLLTVSLGFPQVPKMEVSRLPGWCMAAAKGLFSNSFPCPNNCAGAQFVDPPVIDCMQLLQHIFGGI